MIQINEIMNLSMFKNFKVLCGKEYLTNNVNTAVILEYESSRINYAGYCFGYFVLVSYFFAATNPELVNGSIKNLIQKKVSGIALKIHPDEKLPQEIVDLAVENHVPIVTFYEEFMEDLIININESLKTRSQYVVWEEKLHKILSEKCTPEAIERIALEINGDFKRKIITANLISKEPSSNLQVHTYFDSLMYHRAKLEQSKPWIFVKYELSVILICSFSDEDLKELNPVSYVKNLLSQNGFLSDAFYIGISDTPLLLKQLNEAIEKAQMASTIGKFQSTTPMLYSNTGIYKYSMKIIQQEVICNEIKSKIKILEDYDKQHEANLIKTLVSFVNNNGDYTAISNECFQHTNTIRYRIKKAESLLNLDESTADEEITILIRCFLLLKNLR
ncbi:MAG: PucR family transcriptional regulator ligand-binding domain-containing protein [Treponema sp.]|nr:PucR family transcriptional regulator ligand-binding domain-containing protein [Candidatus Treponema equifaecale]